MALFYREKKDGKRTLGYGVYLIGGLAALAAVWYLKHRAAGDDAAQRRSPPPTSKVDPITSPAALINRVDVKSQEKEKGIDPTHRLAPATPTHAAARSQGGKSAESFDTIDLALEQEALGPMAGGDNHSMANAGGADAASGGAAPPAYPDLPPSFPTEVDSKKGAAANERVQLLGYRDETADVSALPVSASSVSESGDSAPGIVPRGTLICAYLLTTVDTGNPSATIQFGAAKTLIFNHRFQLGFGTRFLGKISGQPNRDRVNLTVDTILYPDGRELPISATAVEADDTGSNIRPGVGAYYFPPPVWAQVSPYIADFITGYMSLLQSRAEQGLTANIGGVSLQTAASADPRPPLYQASSQAVQSFTQARLKDIEQRYATYYLVPAGTTCWLQLDRDLDLKRKQPVGQVAAAVAPVRDSPPEKKEGGGK